MYQRCEKCNGIFSALITKCPYCGYEEKVNNHPKIEKQKVLDVLNGLEVIETNGGDDAYILVDNTEENRKRLNDVGISDEIINKYGDDNAFCILVLAFSEGYCDLYDRGKLITFDKSIEVEVEKGKSIILYKHDGGLYLTISEDSGSIETAKLTDEQIKEIKNVIA